MRGGIGGSICIEDIVLPSLLGTRDKIFYGWVVVAASLVIAAILQGIRLSFGVFFKSLESEFSLNRVAISSVYSVYMVFSAVFTIVGGWALDRYGPRRIIFIMGLLTGLSLLLTSQTNSFWQLFLSYSLLLAIGTGARYSVTISTVSRWFDKKRGLALGITSSGSPLGIIVMVPFAAYLISNFDWRMSYVVLGLVAWLVVISLSMLLRKDPGEIGVLPDGEKLSEGRTELRDREESIQLTGFPLLQAFRTRNFWLTWTAWLFSGLSLHLVLAHVVPYTTDMGISIIEAVTIFSIIGGSNLLSRVLSGRVSDTLGRKVPGIICALFQAGVLVWLIWVQDLWMFYLFAIAFGLSWGGISVFLTAFLVDIFGTRNLGVILGTIEMGFTLGAAIGPAIAGLIFDVTNSYTIAFVIGAAVMLIAALLLALVKREPNRSI